MPENLLTKRIKNWVKTALKTHFVQGNYIPMDGINGTQKIPAEFFSVLNNLSISSTDEYVFAVLDANNAFLFGVKADGSFDWSKGMSQELRTKLKSIFESLESLASNKVDKEIGKSLVNSVFASGVSIVSSDEYLLAILDSDNKILFGVKADGSFDWTKGMSQELRTKLELALGSIKSLAENKVDKELEKSLINEVFASGVSIVSNDEYLFALVDSQDTVVFGIKKSSEVVANVVSDLGVAVVNNVAEMKYGSYAIGQAVDTLGYYSAGDGGGARYIIKSSSDETANGVNKIAVGSDRVAVLTTGNGEVFIEQVGGKAHDKEFDNAVVINAAFNANVKNIRLRDRVYYISSIIYPVRGASLIGVQCSGGSNYPSTIWQQNTLPAMICEVYHFIIENINFVNGQDDAQTNNICFGLIIRASEDSENTTNFGLIVQNCSFYNFYMGIKTQAGSGRIAWDYKINHTTFSNCGVGLEVYRAFAIDIQNCFWTHCGIDVNFEKSCNLTFTACNFGIINKCISMTDYTHHQDQDKSNLSFTGCNFEYDVSISSAVSGAIFDIGVVGHSVNLNLKSCDFVFTHSQPEDVKSFAFSTSTLVDIESCNLIYGNNFYPSSLFDVTRPPKLEDGSLRINHSSGVVPYYDDSVKSVVTADGVTKIDTLSTVTSHKEGMIMYDTQTNTPCYWNGSTFEHLQT